MKRTVTFLAILLTAIMLVTALPVSAVQTTYMSDTIDKYDEYGYYVYYDFENYGSSSDHEVYMTSTTVETADEKLCNPFGFAMTSGNVYGTKSLETELLDDGSENHYYSFVQTQSTDGEYNTIGVFAMQSSINSQHCGLTEAVEISFRIRMHETQPEKATGKMRLINLRRGSASSNNNTDHISIAPDGDVYARIGGSNRKVYENTTPRKFIEISFRWYDATNTYSLYINGDPIVLAMSLAQNYRSTAYVTQTFNEKFIAAARSIVGTADSNRRAIELCRGDSCQYGFDIDDIKISRIETAQGGKIYFEDSFGTVPYVEGTENTRSPDGIYDRVILKSGNNVYTLTQSANISFENNALKLQSGSSVSLTDAAYQVFSQGSFVVEATVKAKPTHQNSTDDEGNPVINYKSLIALHDEINWIGMFYVDPEGNLYLEGNKPHTLVKGYKLDGETELNIAVVALRSDDNDNKFGKFDKTVSSSSYNDYYTLSYFINGEYVGSTGEMPFYSWKKDSKTATTATTASNREATVTYTEVVYNDAGEAENALTVDNTKFDLFADGRILTTDGKDNSIYSNKYHVIYVSKDGKTYYDIEYDAEGKQLRYTTMVVSDTVVGTADQLTFFAGKTYEGSLDNIKVYEGTAPEWYYESINSEQGGNILNIDFEKLALSGSSSKAQTSTSTRTDILGIFRTGGFITGRLTTITPENEEDGEEYTQLNSKSGDWFDFFIPVPEEKNGVIEAEYSFEIEIKDINITKGSHDHSGQLHLFRQRIEDYETSTKVKAYSSGDLFAIDTENKLWAGRYDELSGGDKRFKLCDKDGNQIVLDNDEWNKLRADVHCYRDGTNDSCVVSFYYNDQLLYLSDGSLAYRVLSGDTSSVMAAHFGQPNHRVRITQALSGDNIKFGIKSMKISAKNTEKPVYGNTDGEQSVVNNAVTEFKLDIPQYTKAAKDDFYSVIQLNKDNKADGLVYLNTKTGALAVSSAGKLYSLRNSAGNVILNNTAPTVSVVYNDIEGVARYYVNETLAYIQKGGELVAAVELDSSSSVKSTLESGYALFEGFETDATPVNVENYNLAVSKINDADTAEVIGYQENDINDGIRIIAGVDSLYYSNVGFEVERFENGVSKGVTNIANNVVFSSIVADSTDIVATDEGYKFLATLNITDLPENIPDNSYLLVRSYTDIAGKKHYDTQAKILVSNDGYQFGEVSDKDIYTKKQAVLLIGQSNMAGRGDLNSVEPISDPKITMMRKSGDGYAWVPMVEPLHNDKSVAGVSLGVSFAKAFVETFDQEIGLIPAAVGGTSLAQWTKGYELAEGVTPTEGNKDFDLYEKALAMAKEAQKDSEIVAILWHQGCSDTGNTQYAAKLQVILDDFITDLDLDPEEIVIVTGELARAKGSTADIVNNGLQELVDVYDNYAVTTSEGLITQDENTHFDGPSLRVFGYRYFAHFYKFVTGKTYEFVDDIEYYRITPEIESDASAKPKYDSDYVAFVNFDSLPAGTKESPTTYTSRSTIGNIDIRPVSSTATVQVFPYDYDDDANKYIAVNSISTSGNSVPFVDIVNDYPKGSAIVTEFKIKLGENYAISGPLVKFVQNSPVASTHLIRIETDGRLSNAVNGTTTSAVLKYPGTDTAVTVDKFEWTTIRIVADLANNTKDIYIDGILCLEGAKIKENASDASGFKVDITRLSQLNPGQTGTVYLDDFKSYYAFDVDFENIEPQNISAGAVTDVLTNTRFNHSSSNTGIKIVREGRVNNYLSINSLVTSNDSGYFDVIHAIDAGKTVTVEAKYKLGKVDENNPACRGDMLKFLDPDNKTIALVLLDSDGTLRNSEYAGTSTGPSRTDSIGKLSETEWTTIKVVCDMVNNKKDIYINGVLKVDNAQLYNDNGASTYTIASTRVFQYKSGGIGKLQIDDYRISFE